MFFTRYFMRLLFIGIALFIGSCNSADTDKSAPAPSTTKTSGSESPIISERIDGPANVRDAVNGKILFSLNDNVAVSANAPRNNWLQIGVQAELTQEQKDSSLISKGSRIVVDGKAVGEAIEDIRLENGADLIGYTSISNIKTATIPENIFSTIVNNNKSKLTKENFKRFLKDFQFIDYDSLLPNFKGYEIDENWIDDPSPLARFWLLFEGDKLYGVFHSRPLDLATGMTRKVERGFYFTSFEDDEKKNKDLIKAFNSFITQVD
jgi:hypothetical protein